MKDSLYIIMPAYNEEDSLPTVLDQWYPLVEAHPDSRLVCFNDGSKDRTWETRPGLYCKSMRKPILN